MSTDQKALREAVARAIDPGDWSSIAAHERVDRVLSVIVPVFQEAIRASTIEAPTNAEADALEGAVHALSVFLPDGVYSWLT